MVQTPIKTTALQGLLIDGLNLVPESWVLTPVYGDKRPYRSNWQGEKPLSKELIVRDIRNEKAKGYGLRTGKVSGGIIAVDADGPAAHEKILELSGGEPLPETVAFTSNKPGRCQYLFYVPEEYWETIATKKISTGVKGEDGKEQQLELRWDGCQSVLPPSVHPETGCYRWRKSPQEVAIAPAPMWVIETTLNEPESGANTIKHPDQIQLPVAAIIPLTVCLTHRSRDMLSNGSAAPDKGRNDSGIELARDLIGTANYLDSLGQQYEGNPEHLFFDWCCTCGLDGDKPKGQPQTVWKSASKGNSQPGSGRDGVDACVRGYYWNNHLKATGRGYIGGIGSGGGRQGSGGSGGGGGDNSTQPSGIGFGSRNYSSAKPAPKLCLREASQQARIILQSDADELETNIKLEEIREACGMGSYDWTNKILKPLKRDLEGDRFKFELLGLLQIDDQVERIRQQALLAPKYQMSSSLIEKAMSAMKQRTQTPESKALDLDELFDLESEGLSWVIPGLLPEKETIVLAGAPKAGKTLLAIDVAYAVVTGESHFLSEAVKRGKVLLVSTDESPNSTKAKLLNRGFRRCDKDSIKVLPTWDITQMGTLETLLEDFRPDLVIIDSLRRINKGSEISENSAEFADAIYTLKETLERYGAAGILIHHTNKDREALGVHRLRGSSAIAGAVWGTWQLDQIPKPDPNNKKKLIIDPKDPKRNLSVFARDTEGQQLLIEFNPENSSWAKQGEVGDSEEAKAERDTLRERILKLLAIPAHALGLSGSEIIERLDAGDVNKHSVYNCLNQMASRQLISCKPAPGDKRYNIYSLPQKNPTPEPDFSHTPPSPTPTVVEDDYCAESYVYQDLEDSHINSHIPKKNSHIPVGANPNDDYSTQDVVGSLEIVTPLVNEEGGEGVECQPVVKLGRGSTIPDNAIASDPWEEKYEVINVDADGWGEIVRRVPPQAPVSSTENAPEATEAVENEQTPPAATPNAPALGYTVQLEEELTPVEQAASTSADKAIAPTPIDHDALIDQCETYEEYQAAIASTSAVLLSEESAIAPANSVENALQATPAGEAIAVTPDSELKSPTLPTPAPSEILTSGEAVGRMAHTRNMKREISRESWKITKWCERNEFYTLENGDTAYPVGLVLVT